MYLGSFYFERFLARRLSTSYFGWNDLEGAVVTGWWSRLRSPIHYFRSASFYQETKSKFLCMLFVINLTAFFQSGDIYSAYELFADLRRRANGSKKTSGDSEEGTSSAEKRERRYEKMAERFKDTFSRKDVKVHFLAAWCISASLLSIRKPLIVFETGIPCPPLALFEEKSSLYQRVP
jgi:hypothetical protein